MSDGGFERECGEFQYSRAPDFNQLMINRLSTGPKPEESKPGPNGFDPYKMFIKKKDEDDGSKPVDTTNKVQWPEADVKALSDFCQKHGVMGIDCGNMSPIAALAMVKNVLGFDDRPIEERVPIGHEKLGTKSKYNANFPYEHVMVKKQVLNG